MLPGRSERLIPSLIVMSNPVTPLVASPMPESIDNRKQKQSEPTREQHNDDWPVLP